MLLAVVSLVGCGPDVATTAGGCECPASSGSSADITVDCFEQEFPEQSPSYEETVARATASCDQSLPAFEYRGCGLRTITQSGGYSGSEYVYDDSTLALRGASLYGDVPWGTCETFSYHAGVEHQCSEGSLCPLCEADDAACVPVCSIEAYRMTHIGAMPSFQDLRNESCGAWLRTGCGYVTRVERYAEYAFDASSEEIVAARVTTDAPSDCPAGWGEFPPTCAEETRCFLCNGVAGSCYE